MKKVFIIILFIGLLVFAIGCKKDSDKGKDIKNPEEAKKNVEDVTEDLQGLSKDLEEIDKKLT